MSPVLWFFRVSKAELRNNRVGGAARKWCEAVERCARVGLEPDILIVMR